MMTGFTEKMHVSTRCIHGFMSNLIKKSWTDSNTYITHAFMQGDYANAPTETEALTSFLDDYKDAMENRKAGGRSFR